MIKLSKIKIFKRAMLSVLSLAFLLGGAFFAAKMVKTFHVNAAEGDEEVGAGAKQVTLSVDDTHGYQGSGDKGAIYYGHGNTNGEVHWDNYITRYYKVTYPGTGGKTYLTYCAEPTRTRPAETTYTVSEIAAPGSTNANHNAIKLLVYLSNTSIENQTSPVNSVSLMNELYGPLNNPKFQAYNTGGITMSAADTRYAFVHATVGYLYGTDANWFYGLSSTEQTEVKAIATTLKNALEERATDDPLYIALHDAWLIAQNSTLNTIATDTQHMVWIEPESQSANIEVKKCDSTGKKCSGTELDGITFKLYNDSGRRIYAAGINGGTFFDNGALMATATTTGGTGKVTFRNLPLGVKYKIVESSTNDYYILTPPTSQTITLDKNGGTGHLTFKNEGVSLDTTATDASDGDQFLQAGTTSTIKDVVEYCVVPNKTYTIKGKLMDKSTGEQLLIGGEPVTSEVTITPTTSCGTAEMTFEFDSSELGGKDLVVFETLYLDNEIITSHEDINDPGQTIRVVSLGTTATDASDGDKTIVADGEAIINDRIKYCLVAGKEYTIIGTLMNKSTGEPIKSNNEVVSKSITITPEEDCGEVDMEFKFDTTGLGGTDVVVFEKALILNSITDDYDAIVSHEDLDDEGQTIKIVDKAPETGMFTGSASSTTGSISIPTIIAISISAISVGTYIVTRFTAKKRFFGRR